MALANYSDLQASIAAWVNRTDLTAIIPDFITLAESRISRDLRLRKQITFTNLTTVSGVKTVALPSDWLEFENVSVATSPERQLVYVPVEHIDTKYPDGGGTATPAVFTIEGDNMVFGPIPDAAYTLNIYYYARFPALASASTNWLLTNHPGIYLHACLHQAYLYLMNEQKAEMYKELYLENVLKLQGIDERSSHSGSVLRVKVI